MTGTIRAAVARSPGRISRLRVRERRELAALLWIVAVLTLAGWTLLAAVVVPMQLEVGGRGVGLGLGVTAYTLGVRHAFDADHVAAIDNTTRQLLRAGRPALVRGPGASPAVHRRDDVVVTGLSVAVASSAPCSSSGCCTTGCTGGT